MSKLNIISKAFESNEAWEIEVIGGDKSNIKPTSRNVGTTIQVRDLFFSTPIK